MLIKRTTLQVPDRQRTTVDPKALLDLKDSILSIGLLHAPVVREAPTGGYILVAGGRRLRAIDSIADDHGIFLHSGEPIDPGTVPVTLLTLDSMADILSAELEENIIREDLSWQDRDRALVAIHTLRLEQNPTQTQKDTAEELASAGQVGGAKSPVRISQLIREASIVAPNLDDPAIRNARTHSEAVSLVLQRQADAVNAELIRRRKAKKRDDPIKLIHGDSYAILPTLLDACADLILTDPPYGIDAGARGFRGRTVHHHNYADTPELAQRAIQLCLIEGWRLAKPIANIFLFCDIDHFFFFRDQASTMGWTPFRTPLIWRKSMSEGLAPWGRNGPRRTYECIFFATKGERGLVASPVDVLEVKRVHRSERIFGAQKPLDLMSQLIECSTIPGDTVLDPFLGSGSSLAAARRLNRNGIGIEMDKATFDLATSFIFEDEVEASPAPPPSDVA